MRVLLNAVAAKMSGAANYIQTLARELGKANQHEFLFYVPATQAAAIESVAPHIRVIATDLGKLPFPRHLWFDQVELPKIIQRERVEVLFSTANFATFRCPCRQVLLVRNSLYFSPLYREKVLPHKSWTTRAAEALRRMLVRRSIKAADAVLTPSAAMQREISLAVDVPAVRVSHYGVDRTRFSLTRKSLCQNGFSTLLFSSLYSEHKNVGTLFRALFRLEELGKKFMLVTTADPAWEGLNNSIRKQDYRLATKLRQCGLLDLVGTLRGPSLDRLYQTSDIFVYPSIAESFGHPLVEAMSSGLPIVAADIWRVPRKVRVGHLGTVEERSRINCKRNSLGLSSCKW
jgi:glycosyltransferase involved in cell wall biosynthesis